VVSPLRLNCYRRRPIRQTVRSWPPITWINPENSLISIDTPSSGGHHDSQVALSSLEANAMKAVYRNHRKLFVAATIVLGTVGLAVGSANAATFIGGPVHVINPGGPIITVPHTTMSICPVIPRRSNIMYRCGPVPTIKPTPTTTVPVTVCPGTDGANACGPLPTIKPKPTTTTVTVPVTMCPGDGANACGPLPTIKPPNTVPPVTVTLPPVSIPPVTFPTCPPRPVLQAGVSSGNIKTAAIMCPVLAR
jgi:hypothetical protein